MKLFLPSNQRPRTERRSVPVTRALLAGLATAVSVSAVIAPTAHAGPIGGDEWVVSVGDSYISGEAGRWAGNSSDPAQTDALGDAAYIDAGQSESTAGCHRSSSAEIRIGQAQALNLACSGAKTGTSWNSSGEFKPGLDFYKDAAGNTGQSLALQNFASTHRVSMVVVSVGGNDLGFAGIIATCVSKFMTSPSWAPSYCKDSATVATNFSASNRAAVASRIGASLANVAKAMGGAGYAPGQYSLVVQNYVSPLPRSSDISYSEAGFSRQSTYGCGFWNADLDWATGTAVPAINSTISAGIAASGVAGVHTLNVASLFSGHDLCADTTQKLNNTALADWRSPGAADISEWINEVRTASTAFSDYYIQESLHPNYWGQLALRNCLRQVYNDGEVRSGSCTAGAGLTSAGEPAVSLA
ncbi:hypothetical protein [Arthrobacter oryzae]|uniref:hypothetical protein n=1 Tax=Arthrobacter oryzae TaxID=409290 RepID=UPI00273B4CE2|nr:hypothetical protein [Arthrobacter oryzae]WLQ06692.1 hypothetical protein Q8Z05_00585 [Arthrobacter oryzae]